MNKVYSGIRLAYFVGCATFDDVSGCTVNWLGPCHVGSSKVCHIWFTSLAGSGLVCACNIMCWEHCKWWVTASSNCSSFQDVQWSQLCQAPAVLTRFCQGTFMISQYNCQYNCHTIRQSVFQPTVPQPLARPKKKELLVSQQFTTAVGHAGEVVSFPRGASGTMASQAW